jgi:hypothetical protein
MDTPPIFLNTTFVYISSIQPEIDKYNLDLLKGVITWGEYNQHKKDLNIRYNAERRKIFHSQN